MVAAKHGRNSKKICEPVSEKSRMAGIWVITVIQYSIRSHIKKGQSGISFKLNIVDAISLITYGVMSLRISKLILF